MGSDEATDVSHVTHEKAAIVISNLPELSVIKVSGISARTNDDQLGLELSDLFCDVLVVQQTSLEVGSIWFGREVDAARRNLLGLGLMAMRQMTTLGKGKAHKFFARQQKCSVNLKVSRAARQRLNITSPLIGIAPERFEAALDAEIFDLVDVLVSSVVSLAW